MKRRTERRRGTAAACLLASVGMLASMAVTPRTALAEGAGELGEEIAVPDADTGSSKKGSDAILDPKEFGGGFRLGFWSFMDLDRFAPGVGVNVGIDWYFGMFRMTLDYGYGTAGNVAFSSLGLAFPMRPVRPWIAGRAGYVWGSEEGLIVGPHWGLDLRFPNGGYVQFAWYYSPGLAIQSFGFTAAIILGI